jgi:hypothetical protein
VADCAVAAFPAREALWQPHNRHVRLTRTDAAGRFRLEGLPPAEYYIRAAPGLLETDLYDRHRLTRLAAGARRVSLAQGTTQMLDLKPATPTGSAASVPVSPIGAARD